MRKLVKQGRVVRRRRLKLDLQGHLNVVQHRRVVRAVATVIDVRPVRHLCRDPLGHSDRLERFGLERRALGRLGNVVALIEVENGEVAQERNPILFAFSVRLLNELPEDDCRSLLAFADAAAALLGLFERRPVARLVTAQGGRSFEDPDIHSLVRLAGGQ